MAELIRRKALIEDDEISDVHLLKRDDRKITFVTGDELLRILHETVFGLLERDPDLAQSVLEQIKRFT